MGYEKYSSISTLINTVNQPRMTFLETWQAGAVDALIWTPTNPATGTAWTLGTVTGIGRSIRTVPNATEFGRLVSNHIWDAMVTYWGNNTIQKSLNMEWEMQLSNLANIDNANAFYGLTAVSTDTRSSNNIIGFGLNTDVLETVTDAAGVEQATTTFGETLTNKNRFRIQVTATNVKFYLNGAVIATHATTFPRVPMYLQFIHMTDGGGASALNLGKVRVWWTE